MNGRERSPGGVLPPRNGSLPKQDHGLWSWANGRTLRIVLGTLLSLLFLWLAVRKAPLDQVLATFAVVRYRYVALALALVLLSAPLRALRWKLLYHPAQEGLPVLHLAAILLISQMLNIVLPVRGGEVARIYFMNSTAGRPPAHTLGTIVVEKWLDILMLLVLLLLTPLFVTLPSWFQDSRTTLAVFAVAFFSTALGVSYGQERLLRLAAPWARFLPLRWRRAAREALEAGLRSLDVLRSPRVGLQLQAWSLLIWMLNVLVNYVVFLALGLSLPFAAAVFVLAVLQVGVAVPSAPGRLGVFHYLCVLALSVFGVGGTMALSYGIALYLVVFLPPTALGGLCLWWYMVRPGARHDLSFLLHRHTGS